MELVRDEISQNICFPDLEERRKIFFNVDNEVFSTIIDGMEQKVMSSSDKGINSAIFSGKKKYHTLTKLIAVSRTGYIWFLSSSYFGSISDINLTEFPENFVYKKLTSEEKIMGDKGFRGLEKFNIYSLLKGKSKDVDLFNRNFKHYRSVVENVIGQIKFFKICKEEFKIKMKNYQNARYKHHLIYMTVCSLLNEYVLPLRKI